MKIAKIPDNEIERLKDLESYEILDTLPEMDFDDFTKIASYICETPIALISLVDETRQWFKSKHGLDAPETPREVAFCSHAILEDEVFVIPDSFEDERFHDNPLATGAPDVRFYAGAQLRTPSGNKIGTLCVIDNKPRVIGEKQINALEALARQVVNQLELRLSKKSAESLLEKKTSFFANMSHEIRTPLNGVLGFTGLLLDEKMSKEAYNYVKHIKACGESLLIVINDILDISKIEAGKLNIENIPMNIQKTIEASMLVFKTNVNQKGISLNYNLDKLVPPIVIGDSLRIRQILINLIGNSVKFTERGSIDINVNFLKRKNNKKALLKFEVKDTGIGIPNHAIEKLFQSYEQVESTTTRNYGGTGLGLSICSKLVSLMGGNIWVESVENEGSSFFFTVEVEEGVEDIKNPTLENIEIPTAHVEGESFIPILVAEDNMVNQLIIRKTLNKLGYKNIDFVENGQLALDAIEEKDYSIIFMDVQMPLMDGYEATAAIKSKLESDIKIIGLSANVFEDDKIRAKESGMDDYLEKPIDIKKLKLILGKI